MFVAVPDLADATTPVREPVAVPAIRTHPLRRVVRVAEPYLYLTPAVALLVVWTYRPLVQAAQLSTYSWNLLPTTPHGSRRPGQLPPAARAAGGR